MYQCKPQSQETPYSLMFSTCTIVNVVTIVHLFSIYLQSTNNIMRLSAEVVTSNDSSFVMTSIYYFYVYTIFMYVQFLLSF